MSQPPTSDHRGAPAVRLAWPSEADEVAGLQRRCWEAAGQAEALAPLDNDTLTQAWTQAILAPPMAHFRVLVAHDSAGTVTGFAAIGPGDDPDAQSSDGEIAEFCIDPAERGQGHGSRLLAAAVDTLRSDGYRRALWWIAAHDKALRDFAVSAGWDADGAHREIGPDQDGPDLGADDSAGGRLEQIRLHTAIAD